MARAVGVGDFTGEAAVTGEEYAALERAIDRMGWPEIHAFNAELRKGQDVYEDAGGYFMRAFRRLFGLRPARDEVTTHQEAARAMIDEARRQGDVRS